jgi:hypothetical protein
MKKLIFSLIALVWAIGGAAQGIAGVGRELSRVDFASPSGGARIEVIVTDDAAPAIRTADAATGRASVMAYGVRLFSDSSQDGRANAYGAQRRFAESYPGIGVSVTYEIPAFWVTAGCFVDRIDAVALCGRVLSQFPTAFVVPMEVSVAEIIAIEKNEPSVVEGE